MGCGQSKKIHLYPKKNKNKSNGKKGHDDGTEDDDEERADEREKIDHQMEKEKIDDESQKSDCSSPDPNSNEVIIPILNKKNGPILQSQLSTSQQNFFKMLDQKIENGPDYDSNSETEIAIEEARLNSLVQHWESASLSASMCSSTSRSLQNTPVRQAPLRQPQSMRPQFQQPLSAEILSQQQQMIKQLQHHQTTGGGLGGVGSSGSLSINSPKRVELNSSNRQQLLSQTIIHQTYGVQQPPQQQQQQQQQPMPPQSHILAQYQNQQSTNVAANIQLRQISASSVIPSNYSTSSPSSQLQQQQQQIVGGGISPQSGVMNVNAAAIAANSNNRNLACLPMSYYTPQQPHFVGDPALHSVQVQQQQQQEPRFPPAISVNRLAPQVQRQLRETQELIKDCPPLYGAYPSPNSSTNTQQIQIRSQTRTGLRRPGLETQYSQELS